MVATDAFADIRGQDGAVEVLTRAVAGGRVAHAYAFVGPAGSGARPRLSPSPRLWSRPAMPVGPGASTAGHVPMSG